VHEGVVEIEERRRGPTVAPRVHPGVIGGGAGSLMASGAAAVMVARRPTGGTIPKPVTRMPPQLASGTDRVRTAALRKGGSG
jgi:hypothetical protein